MGTRYISDIDKTTPTADDTLFAWPKLKPVGKISVNMPADEWLCKKLDKLNVTLVEGYPSHSSEAGGLLKDKFVRPVRSKSKWYGLNANKEKESSSVSSIKADFSRDSKKMGKISLCIKFKMEIPETIRTSL